MRISTSSAYDTITEYKMVKLELLPNYLNLEKNMATKANLKPYDYFFIFLLFIFALFIQHTCFFNWDASWHLLGAKRILAGNASYTKNLFDDNLPMVFWFFIPAVLINQYTDINLLFLCNFSVDIVIFISFSLCHYFLTIIYLVLCPYNRS